MPKKIDIIEIRKTSQEKKFVSLAEAYPTIAAEWDHELNVGLTSADFAAHSGKRVFWRCANNHVWDTTIHARTSHGENCPYCSGKRVLAGFNDLVTTHSDVAKTWHTTLNQDIQPADVTFGSNKKVWWICSEKHPYQQTVKNRVRGIGCPICSGRQVLIGYNDLMTTDPEISSEWHPFLNEPLQPTQVTRGSHKRVYWLGICKHSWQASIKHRTLSKSTCPYCSNRKLLTGFNDLATTYPLISDEWHPVKNGNLKPTDCMSYSTQKVWWKCRKNSNHEWYAEINSRTSHGSGCPICCESKGEQEIRKILMSLNTHFKEQFVFKDRKYNKNGTMKDDFAILHNNQVVATIEYHGEQHYEPVDFAGKGEAWAKKQLLQIQERDAVKTKYLQEHHIPQLIIPYWEYDNISTLVQNFISTL